MIRILLMVLRNLWRVPAAWFRLCHYAKHTDRYPETEKWAHIQYILKRAVKTGNIDLQVYGKENIPVENGFVMYGNHQGLFDVLAIAASCDNPVGAVLKKELCDIPFLKQVKECTYSFGMDRQDIRQSMEVIKAVTEELKKGRNYVIFPEGTRSRNGNRMLEFHSGSFRCAVKSKCPVVPFALRDSFRVLDQKGIKPVRVEIHYLKPIYYDEYKDMTTVELASMVREKIREIVEKTES